MSEEKLVYMANQIARFFAPQGDDAIANVTDHLVKFWDPRMRAAIKAHLATGRTDLDPVAESAVRRLPDMAAEPTVDA